MCTIVIEDSIRIPDGITDLDAFRRWARSDLFPQDGQLSFCNGEVWVDMSPEQLFSHNKVKGEFAIALGTLVKQNRSGHYFHDRALISTPAANLSTEPDGLFISKTSSQENRIRFIENSDGFIEIEGPPDMVLEVVSPTSARKDSVVLRDLYWKAGVTEYWLVDARGDHPQLHILQRANDGYVIGPEKDGWHESNVFGRSFRLTVEPDEMGYPEYTLSVR